MTEPSVSRETKERLDLIVRQLEKWQPRINLVASSTMGDIWNRHIRDSLQLISLAPADVRSWVDLGSGGGFPGLVVAAHMAENPAAKMILIESNAKKCAFLRETARLAALPVTVLCERIETALPAISEPVDVVSARALTSLVNLLEIAEPIVRDGAIALFPKGQDVDDEIAFAMRTWNFRYDLIQSVTESAARVLRITKIARRMGS